VLGRRRTCTRQRKFTHILMLHFGHAAQFLGVAYSALHSAPKRKGHAAGLCTIRSHRRAEWEKSTEKVAGIAICCLGRMSYLLIY
jgi:hypothetical protein